MRISLKLLDQLGKSSYFSTLDLASGFWQIKMHPASQEKTAFCTPHGLFEFKVMPFGLTNAPSVFQRLMQQILSSTNTERFVTAYIDDLLVFSSTLSEHLQIVYSWQWVSVWLGLHYSTYDNPHKICASRPFFTLKQLDLTIATLLVGSQPFLASSSAG